LERPLRRYKGPSLFPGHIQVKADAANTGTIFIAARSNETTNATAATAGLTAYRW